MARKQIDIINFLKGISITSIVVYHLIVFFLDVTNVLGLAATFGGTGVHIFFICSGFGLSLSYKYRPLKWIEFLKKRFFKVYIPYIAVVVVSFFIPFMYTGEDRVAALLSHVFLYKMFVPEYMSSFGLQLWFVSTIIQFYLVFHLLVKVKIRWGNKTFFLFSCIISAIWIVFTIVLGIYEERIWNSFFLQYLWEFGLGMCLIDATKDEKIPLLEDVGIIKIIIITMVAFVMFAIISMQGAAWKSMNDFLGVIAFGGIGIVLYRIKWLRPIFISLSKISYEWYLVHIIVFTLFFYVFTQLWVYSLTGILVLGISIGIACLYKYLWDKIYNLRRTEVNKQKLL